MITKSMIGTKVEVTQLPVGAVYDIGGGTLREIIEVKSDGYFSARSMHGGEVIRCLGPYMVLLVSLRDFAAEAAERDRLAAEQAMAEERAKAQADLLALQQSALSLTQEVGRLKEQAEATKKASAHAAWKQQVLDYQRTENLHHREILALRAFQTSVSVEGNYWVYWRRWQDLKEEGERERLYRPVQR